jgi:hypothetical protein
MKWRKIYDILCDMKVSNKLKSKFYRMTIRPAMMYGAECWATKGQHIQKMSVAEMRMLCWICGHTRWDRIKNDDIRDELGIASIQKKLIQHRLWWFSYIQRSSPANTIRERGRPRLTWEKNNKKIFEGMKYIQIVCFG